MKLCDRRLVRYVGGPSFLPARPMTRSATRQSGLRHSPRRMGYESPGHSPKLDASAHLAVTITETDRMAKSAGQSAPIPTSDKAAALALTPVSRETEARLDRY